MWKIIIKQLEKKFEPFQINNGFQIAQSWHYEQLMTTI
jgi:hypothetical protein